MRTLLIPLALALCATGCTDPIVATWEEDPPTSSYEGEMVLEDDQTGEYEVEFTEGTTGKLVFEVEWFETGDDGYELELDCDKITGELGALTSCDALESWSDWECTLKSDDQKLECENDGPEGNQELEFDRKD